MTKKEINGDLKTHTRGDLTADVSFPRSPKWRKADAVSLALPEVFAEVRMATMNITCGISQRF
jgi:hypothetical protein